METLRVLAATAMIVVVLVTVLLFQWQVRKLRRETASMRGRWRETLCESAPGRSDLLRGGAGRDPAAPSQPKKRGKA